MLLEALKRKLEGRLAIPDPPSLVRLNPFVPWKTRGNAAVAAELLLHEQVSAEGILLCAAELADQYNGEWERKGGVVVLQDPSAEQAEALASVYRKALTDVLAPNFLPDAVAPGSASNLLAAGKRGVLGALAAAGFVVSSNPRTFELLLYRRAELYERDRGLSDDVIKTLEHKYRGSLFNNFDWSEGKAVAIPKGPDPVMVGLRALEPCALLESVGDLLRLAGSAVEAWALFQSNQHTDAHALPVKAGLLRPYRAGLLEGVVASRPLVARGGHVSFEIADETGCVEVFCYGPTKPLSTAASMLRVGDYVRVLGGAVPHKAGGLAFNAQKMWILEEAPELKLANPRCPACGKRLKSSGSRGGYKCPRCGLRVGGLPKEPVLGRGRGLRGAVFAPAPGRIGNLVKPVGVEPLPKRTWPCLREAPFFAWLQRF